MAEGEQIPAARFQHLLESLKPEEWRLLQQQVCPTEKKAPLVGRETATNMLTILEQLMKALCLLMLTFPFFFSLKEAER